MSEEAFEWKPGMDSMNAQSDPVPNNFAHIADLVCADIQEKKRMGMEKYGTPLQAFNGRNSLQDAYQEAIDLTKYLKQKLEEEREGSSIGKMHFGIQELIRRVHTWSRNCGWWNDLVTGEDLAKNPLIVSQKLLLIVTEIAEATEGHRKNLMDDKLPKRTMLEVELADAIIRIVDLAGALNLDLAGAVVEKMEYNSSRVDHKVENRKKEGGKIF